MRRSFAVFFSIILMVMLLVNAYIGWHGRLFLSEVAPAIPGSLYWSVFWIVALSYLLSRMTGRVLPRPFAGAFKYIGSYWFAVMQYGILILPFADAAGGIAHAAGVPKESYVPALGYIVLAALAAILLWGSWNARNPIVRRYEIEIPKEAGGLKQLRIGMASDLHLGVTIRKRNLRVLTERMKALRPDLILLPGDVLDDDIEPFLRQRMAEEMKELRAKYGVYAVLGNHEYIGGHIGEYVRAMKEAGIEVLMDRHVEVAGGIAIAGRKDRMAERVPGEGRMPLEELLAGVDRAKPLILMDHQPYGLEQAAAAGVDLMLSGHTHRGQMAPNHWITGRLFELDWGYLRKGGLHVVVSSGFGSWGPPIRLGSRSEIVEILVAFTTPEPRTGPDDPA